MWYKRILLFLFPRLCVSCKKEGYALCATCGSALHPRLFAVEPTTWSLLSYSNEKTKKIVHKLKYEQRKDLAPILGSLLSLHLDMIIGEDDVVIVPIPSAPKELGSRGFDHVALLAESIVNTYHGPIRLILFPALQKTRETISQVKTTSRSERLSNLIGVYRPVDGTSLRGKTVLLIDDVTTTGATFAEARRALKHSGAKEILALAIAH
jgi:ComF family protein